MNPIPKVDEYLDPTHYLTRRGRYQVMQVRSKRNNAVRRIVLFGRTPDAARLLIAGQCYPTCGHAMQAAQRLEDILCRELAGLPPLPVLPDLSAPDAWL